MTFFPEPIKPSEGREDDAYRIDPIEADKQGKERIEIERQEKEKRANLYGAFLLFFKNLIDLFDASGKKTPSTTSNGGLLTHLKAFKTLLEKIQELDQSENSLFCEELSEVWGHLLQDVQVLSYMKKNQEVDVKKLSALITAIDRYPPQEEHPLGYYLSQYAGKDWLPLPFRNILKALHSEHRAHQKNSLLSEWVQRLEDLLQS